MTLTAQPVDIPTNEQGAAESTAGGSSSIGSGDCIKGAQRSTHQRDRHHRPAAAGSKRLAGHRIRQQQQHWGKEHVGPARPGQGMKVAFRCHLSMHTRLVLVKLASLLTGPVVRHVSHVTQTISQARRVAQTASPGVLGKGGNVNSLPFVARSEPSWISQTSCRAVYGR